MAKVLLARPCPLSALLGCVLACNVLAWLLVVQYHPGFLSHNEFSTAGAAADAAAIAGGRRAMRQGSSMQDLGTVTRAPAQSPAADASLGTTPLPRHPFPQSVDPKAPQPGVPEIPDIPQPIPSPSGTGSAQGLTGLAASGVTTTALRTHADLMIQQQEQVMSLLTGMSNGVLDPKAEAFYEAAQEKKQLALQAEQVRIQADIRAHRDDPNWPPVWWFAPFFDRTSFGKEAATLLLGAVRSGAVNESSLWLGTTQANCKYDVDTSMPPGDFQQLDAAVKRAKPAETAATIVVCHSLPPFWARPRHHWETCAPCPPMGYTAARAIGRAMAETDIYNWAFVEQCNRMDEIWVPSKFSYDVLKLSGVKASKLHIVPIAVNTTLYDPEIAKPLPLPIGDMVFGSPRRFEWHRIVVEEDASAGTFKCPAEDPKRACSKIWRLRAACRAEGRRDCERSFQAQAEEYDEDAWPSCARTPGYVVKSNVDHVLDDIICQEGDDVQEAADACTADPKCEAFNLDPYDGHWCLKSRSRASHRPEALGVCFYTKKLGGLGLPGPGAHPGLITTPSSLGKLLVGLSAMALASASSASVGGTAGVAEAGWARGPARGALAFGDGSGSPGTSRGLQKGLRAVGAALPPALGQQEDRAGSAASQQGQQGRLAGGLRLVGNANPTAGRSLAAAVSKGATLRAGQLPASSSQDSATSSKGSQAPLKLPRPPASAGQPFVFVSTFKWEMRKGWDVLLRAYLAEFSSADNVELYILTKPFADSGSDFKATMHRWAREQLGITRSKRASAPTLYVIAGHITTEQYIGLYRSAHCYVSPTRGEGWGMPITEAMSMGLPAIVTNWSGTADFVDESVGYPLRYNLTEVPEDQLWWFRGARWADADVGHLRQLMRHVYENRAEAAARGAAARRLMHSTYSPAAVGRSLAAQVARVRALIKGGNCTDCFNREYVADSSGPWGLDPYPNGEPRRPGQAGAGESAAGGGKRRHWHSGTDSEALRTKKAALQALFQALGAKGVDALGGKANAVGGDVAAPIPTLPQHPGEPIAPPEPPEPPEPTQPHGPANQAGASLPTAAGGLQQQAGSGA